MAMNQTLSAAKTATTAAGTNTAKATAIVSGTLDALVAVIAKAGPLTPQQQQAAAAFKAVTVADAANIRIAIYGS